MNLDIKVHTDGGSRGNPGPSACAWVVSKHGKQIGHGAKYLGVGTNNKAEYSGVICALEWLQDNKEIISGNIQFILDSELIVRQLNGIYKVKDLSLRDMFVNIKILQKKFDAKFSYVSVPRSSNKEADKLVNEELDRVLKS